MERDEIEKELIETLGTLTVEELMDVLNKLSGDDA